MRLCGESDALPHNAHIFAGSGTLVEQVNLSIGSVYYLVAGSPAQYTRTAAAKQFGAPNTGLLKTSGERG